MRQARVLLRALATVGFVDIRWSGGRRSGGLRHPDANRRCGRGGGKAKAGMDERFSGPVPCADERPLAAGP
jgi:hypothetical protein